MEKRHPLAAQRCPQHTGVLRAAGTGTHDVCPHGLVCGEWVESSRFVMFWCDSIRDGMEHYGDLYAALVPPRPWRKGSVPFGWNSYSAVGRGCNCLIGNRQGNFIRTALPNFCGEPGETFINLDGALGLDEQKIRQIIEELHKKGQKAGWYAIPATGSQHLVIFLRGVPTSR